MLPDDKTQRKTVGAHSSELLAKPDGPTNPQEYQRASQKDYIETLLDTAVQARKKWEGDFFITVVTKKERLMKNVLRNYFMARHSCPTPDYDQTVYKFRAEDEEIVFLWTIPAQDICYDLLRNALQIPPEERDLLYNIIRFKEGELMKLAQIENKEFA